METGLSLILVMAAIIVVLGGVMIVREMRARRREKARDKIIQSLQGDIHALCAGAAGMGNQITAFERKLRQLAERQHQADMRDPNVYSYDRAVNLARKGAPLREITGDCGLSRGEAELLLRLQNARAHQSGQHML